MVEAIRSRGIEMNHQPARFTYHPSGAIHVHRSDGTPRGVSQGTVDLDKGPYWQLGSFLNKYPEMYPLASESPVHGDLVVDVTALSCTCFATTPFLRRAGAHPHQAWEEWRPRCDYMAIHVTSCPTIWPDMELGVVVYSMPSIREKAFVASEISATNASQFGDDAWTWVS